MEFARAGGAVQIFFVPQSSKEDKSFLLQNSYTNDGGNCQWYTMRSEVDFFFGQDLVESLNQHLVHLSSSLRGVLSDPSYALVCSLPVVMDHQLLVSITDEPYKYQRDSLLNAAIRDTKEFHGLVTHA